MGILTVLEGHVQEKRRQNVMRSRMSAFILMGMRWSLENVSGKIMKRSWLILARWVNRKRQNFYDARRCIW